MAISCEPGPSLEEILSRHGLKETDLDQECPQRIRDEIAGKLDNWEMVGRCLEFTLEKLRDINRENTNQELCRIALLDTWSKREGKGATYLKLADAFHRRKRRDLVEFLCEKIKSSMRFRPLPMPITSWDMPLTVKTHVHHRLSSSEGFLHTVSSQIETLEEQFDDIHDCLVTELSEGGATSVDKLLQALTKLPFAFRKEYESTVQYMLPDLEKKNIVRNLFLRLNPLFTFIDYKLLEHLVSKFGSPELKGNMLSYVEKVQLFKKVTTVSELMDYWPGLEVPHVNYNRLRAKFEHDPRTYTLENLDSFRRKFFNHLRLSEFISVSILMLLEPASSFFAEWFVPTVIVPELMEAFGHMDKTFFQVEQLIELSLDESMLYQRNVLSESAVNESGMSLLSASTHQTGESDALYSLLVSAHSTYPIYNVYIAAHFHYTALKILKLRRKHVAFHGKHPSQFLIKNFMFKKGDSDHCIKLIVPKNTSIIAVQPEDGMIRVSDIWRESRHEDLQDRLLDYHLKITMKGTKFDPLPSIKFEGSTELKMRFNIDRLGGLMVKFNDNSTRRWQDLSSEQTTLNFVSIKDIQFGYHSTSGKKIRITNDGLGTEKMNLDWEPNNGVVCGARPLKGMAEFEVKIVSYGTSKGQASTSQFSFGVMRCKKGAPIEYVPIGCKHAANHCVWVDYQLCNNLVTPGEVSDYGYVDLDDVREGDRVGLRLSQDRVLEFFVNGESQGIAVRNIYSRNSDVYAVVDHGGNCMATVITKAVTQYEDINLQELCLDKLSGWLKGVDEVDRLSLPTRLKDKLKEYFYV